MNCSTPGLPVHHQLPEFTQTHVHHVSDAIQSSHPLLSPSPSAPNPSQHQGLFQFWFPQGIFLAVGLLGHVMVLFLAFKGIFIPSSTLAVSTYILTTVQKGSLFSTPSTAFIACRLLDTSHPDWRVILPHCGFDLHFSDNE